MLRRLIGAVAEGELDAAAGRRALGQFDELLHDALGRLHVGPAAPPRSTADGSGGGAVAWRWEGAETRLESVLWPLLWEAARLLASPDAARLRVCAGVDCGWVYVDRSRNGLRRWCEMQTCGTREKGRRRAGRARGGVAR